MQIEWFGKYRNVIGGLFRAANAYSLVCMKEFGGKGDIHYSPYEVQIMEHIMEHENVNMKTYANMLGLKPSTFTKYVQKLVDKGLVEKYHIVGNKKDIVLKVSPLGYKEYQAYSERVYRAVFKAMFDKLDEMSPEQYKIFEEFVGMWSDTFYHYIEQPAAPFDSPILLVKIE